MNNTQLFFLVLTITASSCMGVLLLATKLLPEPEAQNGPDSCLRTKGPRGLPPPATLTSFN